MPHILVAVAVAESLIKRVFERQLNAFSIRENRLLAERMRDVKRLETFRKYQKMMKTVKEKNKHETFCEL